MAKKPVDVLLFIEHTARELDISCAVKYLAKKRHGLDVEIASIFFDSKSARISFDPAVVALPYCFSINSFNIGNLLRAWPDATYVNLAYEQIFRPHQLSTKAPADSFVRHNVIHHSWAEFNSEFLTEHGVKPANIVLNGNPTYSLYTEPYTAFFPSREELADRLGLDAEKRWVFIPENYGAAFGTDMSVRKPDPNSVDQAQAVRRFALDSFRDAVIWWATLARDENIELIVRPRPATPESEFRQAMEGHVKALPRNLHVTKSGSTREWILASDVTFSSYSTSLIESSVARKPSFMLAPHEFPDYLDADWHKMVQHVTTYEEFRAAACDSADNSELNALGEWAERVMMSVGDPISNLVNLLAGVREGEIQPSSSITRKEIEIASPAPPRPSLASRVASKGRRTLADIYHTVGSQPPSNHEYDGLSQSDISERVSRWKSVLG